MLGDEHLDGLTHSQQTDLDLWKAFSSCSSSSSRNGSERAESIGPVNAERQRSRVWSKKGQVSKLSMIPETNEFGDEANRRLVECNLDASKWSRTQLNEFFVFNVAFSLGLESNYPN